MLCHGPHVLSGLRCSPFCCCSVCEGPCLQGGHELSGRGRKKGIGADLSSTRGCLHVARSAAQPGTTGLCRQGVHPLQTVLPARTACGLSPGSSNYKVSTVKANGVIDRCMHVLQRVGCKCRDPRSHSSKCASLIDADVPSTTAIASLQVSAEACIL
jgi:hypothetical protein